MVGGYRMHAACSELEPLMATRLRHASGRDTLPR